MRTRWIRVGVARASCRFYGRWTGDGRGWRVHWAGETSSQFPIEIRTDELGRAIRVRLGMAGLAMVGDAIQFRHAEREYQEMWVEVRRGALGARRWAQRWDTQECYDGIKIGVGF